jgi:hypothetical protein
MEVNVIRSFFAGILMLVTSLSFADMKVKVTLPTDREYAAFESAEWPKSEPKLWPMAKKEDTVTLPDALTTTNIFLLDKEKGRLARISTSDLKEGSWKPAEADFKIIEKVKLEILTPKGPIGIASLKLQDGTCKREELLEPINRGEIYLFCVPSGELKALVNYKVAGKTEPTFETVVKVDLKGDKSPTFKINLPGGEPLIETAAVSTSRDSDTGTSKQSPSAPQKVEGGSPFGNILVTLLGLAFIVGAGYFIVKYLRGNPDAVKDTLVKLGADIPTPQDPSAPVVPTSAPAPQPVQQIILDPVPIANVPAVSAVVPMVSTGIPSMVSLDGSRFDIPDGETVVGREFGTGLMIPNDTVSRKHASIHKSGTNVEVQDHGSTNGTWLNGVKVAGSHPLNNGDSVRFGSVEYRYEA